ncbi:MAG: hypothetical protein KF683_18580 [Rubrivivax sp.]|nr:hypothetical protein [Rubrivivax sp.]
MPLKIKPSSLPALLAATAALNAPVHAGRPLATEDAGLLEPRACELEAFVGRARERDAPRLDAASLQVGCGFGLRSQAALGVGRESAAGERSRSLGLSGKTGLRDGGDDATSFALAWGLGAADAPGTSMRLETTYLTGVATLPLGGALALHANLGWSRSRSASASTTGWALALEHAGESGIDVMGEVFGDDRDRRPWVQVGVRASLLPERLWLDASAGVQLWPARPKLLTVGVKLAF